METGDADARSDLESSEEDRDMPDDDRKTPEAPTPEALEGDAGAADHAAEPNEVPKEVIPRGEMLDGPAGASIKQSDRYDTSY